MVEWTAGTERPSAATSVPEMREPGSLTATLWSDGQRYYDEISASPFIRGLVTGDLSERAFTYYLVQDHFYIDAYLKCLATLASRATSTAAYEMLLAHMTGAVGQEAALFDKLVAGLGTRDLVQAWTEPSPTAFGYMNFISTSCTSQPFLQGLVSVLPCYWLYARLGADLEEEGSAHPVYAAWIDNYREANFDAVAAEALDCVDDCARSIDQETWSLCRETYRRSCQYEWMFWDAAYRLESWPV